MLLFTIAFASQALAEGEPVNFYGYGHHEDGEPAWFDGVNITVGATEYNQTTTPQVILYQNVYQWTATNGTHINPGDTLVFYAINGTRVNTSYYYTWDGVNMNPENNITFMTSGIANHVVISDVQVEGATANDEFVELYNPTNIPISLSGWYLTKKTSGGNEQNLLADIPIGKSIPARGFFLITPQTGYTGPVTADTTYSQTSYFIATDNTVILYSDNKITVVDKVGFGDAVDNETLSYPTNPPDNKSLQRKINATLNESGSYGPAWDTDNNSVDFFIRTNPNPQNSSAEPVPPIPELNTLILVSSGLIALVGYVLLRRKW